MYPRFYSRDQIVLRVLWIHHRKKVQKKIITSNLNQERENTHRTPVRGRRKTPPPPAICCLLDQVPGGVSRIGEKLARNFTAAL